MMRRLFRFTGGHARDPLQAVPGERPSGERSHGEKSSGVRSSDERSASGLPSDGRPGAASGAKPFRLAVFASGSGSNFQAIVDAVRDGRLDAKVELLVCDQPQAKVVERAKEAGIPAFVFRAKDYPTREAYEREILAELQARQIDLVALAGYMRIVTDVLLTPFWGKMINIHPSLLPSFPGLHAVRQALEHGVKVTGVTVHFVDGGLDSGPIIVQRALDVKEDDTEETLTERIHAIEHELYPLAIRWIRENRVKVQEDGRRVAIAAETAASS